MREAMPGGGAERPPCAFCGRGFGRRAVLDPGAGGHFHHAAEQAVFRAAAEQHPPGSPSGRAARRAASGDRGRAARPARRRRLGSNNWAVSGDRSVTGKPLLANDPHLGLSVPGVWYFAHLSAPGLEVIGATLPGIPAVLIGRNDRIAWGFTNTYGDVQDVFIERVLDGDRSRYESPEGPRPFRVREEVIEVKDAGPVHLAVRLTRHGPVISDLMPGPRRVELGNHVLALAWTALAERDSTARAPLEMARAGNWSEFTAALRFYAGPQQSMVYADVDGHIGLYAPAHVPLRHPGNRIRGALPVPGWDARFDWAGLVPFAELPQRLDPAGSAIATANNAIVGADYPHHITYDWEHPYRIRRIDELLAARTKHSIDSFARAQGDNVSLMARDFLALLAEAEPRTEAGARALRMLRAWDGDMDAGRAEPLIFSRWYGELEALVYADELGPLFDQARRLRPRFMHRVLTTRHGWCDDISTATRESCGELIAQALDEAARALTAEHGEDPARWLWGDVHYAHMKHLPFTYSPGLDRIFDLRTRSGGGPYTVNRGDYNVGDATAPFAQVHGASLRVIYDLDDLDRSLYVHTTGQSGHPLSRFFDNFVQPWRDIEYIPMTMARRDYAAGAHGTLVLTPAP